MDLGGHSKNWTSYTNYIMEADTIVYDLYQKIQQDPFYEDNTAIIVTSDHGRHLDGISSGFVGHGCYCLGCREVMFLAIGPGIKQDTEIRKKGYLHDIAPTVAWMLGFRANFSEGRVLREMFESPPEQEQLSARNPSMACDDGNLHLAYRETGKGQSSIVYMNSPDNGQTWSDSVTLSTSSNVMFPSIAAEGGRVAVAWCSYRPNGYWKMAFRESIDGGSSWLDIYYGEGLKYPTFTDLEYYNGIAILVWAKSDASIAKIYLAWHKDGDLPEYVKYELDQAVLWPRCIPTAEGIHVVFQDFTLGETSWGIDLISYDGSQWLAPLPLNETSGQSLHPDIAADSSGIHVVWAEEQEGTYKIMARNSVNGLEWGDPLIIGESTSGAWHPRIAAGDSLLVVVWEGFERMSPAIFCTKSTDGGNSWSSSTKISDDGPAAVFPDLAVDDQDQTNVFWMKLESPIKLDSAILEF